MSILLFAEERLFYAYFTEGLHFGDPETLKQLGKDIGVSETEVLEALQDERYADAVRADIEEAGELGIQGVPFFVFDRKYAVSGAQPPAAFTEALTHAYREWQKVETN